MVALIACKSCVRIHRLYGMIRYVKNQCLWEGKIIKKVILGSMMFLSGTLAAAIILAGAMANELNVNGRLSAIWNITQYGLMPAIIVFSIIAVIGLLFALWGVFEKKQ